jgi:hypothetical protein
MMQYASQIYGAAEEAGDPPPSLAALVWFAWKYLKTGGEIAARWREYVPSGQRRGGRCKAPERTEAEDPRETIEHVGVLTMKFFDLEAIVAQARRDPLSVSEDEMHDIRTVDGLLFEMFGDEGMMLSPRVYAAPLADAVTRSRAALHDLAACDRDAECVCGVLNRLEPFYRDYCPWAPVLSFAPWAHGPGQALALWRDVLCDLKTMARAMVRSPMLAGSRAPAWRAVSTILENSHVYLRLRLAMRVAVERDNPACRHLCASAPLLAQHSAARVGLAHRRCRLHPRSEGAIMAEKLRGRRQTMLAVNPTQDHFRALSEVLADECGRLLELHTAQTPDPQVRELALACGERIDRYWRELSSTVQATGGGRIDPRDARLLEASAAAAATARDVVDGFYAPNRYKGLRTLIPLRWGDALDDMLARV